MLDRQEATREETENGGVKADNGSSKDPAHATLAEAHDGGPLSARDVTASLMEVGAKQDRCRRPPDEHGRRDARSRGQRTPIAERETERRGG